ncbi:ATP12 family chaperone protein [Roseibium limicola]|uniref:ATPase n=1 Tax=Roseibium limicola TaxID=2816037 RepID=A0A939J804_9HYPH|nr:ATP12 family protein [Roseibium limicola]MBO0344796.1 ATPase [Roseibium limicola]
MRDELTPFDKTTPEDLARKLSKRELPKRFYKEATYASVEGGFAIHLDGRAVKTPGRVPLVLAQESLAKALAAEWHAQVKVIDPGKMPLTRIVNSALDAVTPRFAEVADDAAKYCGTDLVCYRADTPQKLVDRQMAEWDPVVAWAEDLLGGKFTLVAGLIHREQPQDLLRAYRACLDKFTPIQLAAFHTAVTLTGSALLALAVAEGQLQPDQAWKAAHVDEDFNIELWGQDADAAELRAYKKSEFDAAILVLTA